VRRFLARRDTEVSRLKFRAVVPVSVRSEAELGSMGNRVSAWLIDLPVHEPNTRDRYRSIVENTTRLKQSKQAQSIETLAQIAEMVDPIHTLGVRLAARVAPYNLIVTNVPGPQFPLYLLGSRLLAGYPTVPLFEYQALGVAIFSYDNRLHFGLNADWELVPDLHDLVTDLDISFRELHRLAQPAEQRRPTVTAGRASRRRGGSVHRQA
jgi:hypothetical protein